MGSKSRLLASFVAFVVGGALLGGGCSPGAEPLVVDPHTLNLHVVDESGASVPHARWVAGGAETLAGADGIVSLSLDQPVAGVIEAPGYLAQPLVLSPHLEENTTVRVWSTHASNGHRRVSLHFGGDVMLGRRYLDPGPRQQPLVTPGDGGASARAVVSHVGPLLAAADMTTINLESVIGDLTESEAYPGKRYLIQSPVEVLAALDEMGVDVVALGNNHVYDWQQIGLDATVDALEGAGLAYAGAGVTADEARAPAFVDVDGLSIATLSYTTVNGDFVNDALPTDSDPPSGLSLAERWPYETRTFGFGSPGDDAYLPEDEYSAGDVWRWFDGLDGEPQENTWAAMTTVYPELQDWVARRGHGGAARFTRSAVADDVQAARQAGADVVIVQIHGGYQFSDVASSFFRSAAQSSVEAGADLVIGHHPHVIQGFEWYQDKLIAHSLGNLVFDQDFHSTFASMMLRVVMEGSEILDTEVLPVFLDDYQPIPAAGQLAQSILAEIHADSAHGASSRRLDNGIIARVVLQPSSGDAAILVTGNSGRVVPSTSRSLIEASHQALATATDLLRWGTFSDQLADGELGSGAGWAVDSAVRARAVVIDPASGLLGIELNSTYVSGALIRPGGRLPLERHRLFTPEGDPVDSAATYTVRVTVRREGRGDAFVRVDPYRFDDSNPLRSPVSEKLGRFDIELPLESVDGWQVVEIDVPAEAVDGADAVMLYLGIRGGTSTRVVLSDVQFLEWREGSSLPAGVRTVVSACRPSSGDATPGLDRTCPAMQPGSAETTAGAPSPSGA